MNKTGKHQLNQLIKDNSTSNNILMQSTEKGILLFLIAFLSEMNSLNLYTRKYETNINWGCTQNSWLTYMLQKTSQVALVGKNPSAKCSRCKRCKFDPWFERSPGGGHGNPLQFSCLENPVDRGASRLRSIGSQRVRHYWNDLA